MPIVRVRKAYAYIVRGGSLLVFRHVDIPEAGVQVPGGSIEPGEMPIDAALREAREETGLDGLRVVRFLGFDRYGIIGTRGDLVLGVRHFYLLELTAPAPDAWLHGEGSASDGTRGFIPFAFEWWPLASMRPGDLIGAQDAFVPLFLSVAGST